MGPRPNIIRRSVFARRLLAVLSLLLPCQALLADFLLLKDGRLMQGTFETIADGKYVFRHDQDRVRIPLEEVERLVIGYGGVPVCYRSDAGKRDCSALLFVLDSETALLGEGKAPWYRARRISVTALSELSFTFKNGQAGPPRLQPGARLTLPGESGPETFVVTESSPTITKMRSLSGTQVETLGARRISAAGKTETDKPETPAKFWNIIPGIPQLRRDETLYGGSLLGGFTAFSVLWIYEYQRASALATRINSDPLYLYFRTISDPGPREQYRRSVRNQGLYAALDVIVVAIHLWELLLGSGSDSGAPAGTARARAGLFLEFDSSRVSLTTPDGNAGLRLGFQLRF